MLRESGGKGRSGGMGSVNEGVCQHKVLDRGNPVTSDLSLNISYYLSFYFNLPSIMIYFLANWIFRMLLCVPIFCLEFLPRYSPLVQRIRNFSAFGNEGISGWLLET